MLKSLPLQRLDSKSGLVRIIPGIFGPGNHDIGYPSYSRGEFQHDKSMPLYKHYLPQNTFQGDIPKLTNRSTYFAHRIGDHILILSLDAGYAADMDGDQTAWLESELLRHNYKIKIANYHNAIFRAYEFAPNSEGELTSK